jgi:hypothetical protein
MSITTFASTIGIFERKIINECEVHMNYIDTNISCMDGKWWFKITVNGNEIKAGYDMPPTINTHDGKVHKMIKTYSRFHECWQVMNDYRNMFIDIVNNSPSSFNQK